MQLRWRENETSNLKPLSIQRPVSSAPRVVLLLVSSFPPSPPSVASWRKKVRKRNNQPLLIERERQQPSRKDVSFFVCVVFFHHRVHVIVVILINSNRWKWVHLNCCCLFHSLSSFVFILDLNNYTTTFLFLEPQNQSTTFLLSWTVFFWWNYFMVAPFVFHCLQLHTKVSFLWFVSISPNWGSDRIQSLFLPFFHPSSHQSVPHS